MLMVGLTGGIGAGKSSVATRLSEWGAMVIDSDRLAREVVAAGTPGLAEVVAAFGPEVLTPAGDLDRAAVARVVFADAGQRRRLEQIIHPLVRERVLELVAAAPEDAIVVNDVPLLVENGMTKGYDLVIVVLASERSRIDRLGRDRGMPEAEARARLSAQATDAQRREVADILIENEGTLADLRAAVDVAWRDRILPLAEAGQHKARDEGPPAAGR
jgi:dephospho-CoA kinase